MDIINGLHGVGIALAIGAVVTLLILFFTTYGTEEDPPHAAKIIVTPLSMAVIAGFLIGATS